MPFADTTQMLHAAQAGGYAVGAFNAENMEMAQAIVLAAQEARAPVILQTTPSTLRYADPQLYWLSLIHIFTIKRHWRDFYGIYPGRCRFGRSICRYRFACAQQRHHL